MIDSLRKQLDRLRKTGDVAALKPQRLSCIREALEAELDRLVERHRQGASGADVVGDLTEGADGLIRVLYEQACLDTGGQHNEGYAILALGGYGRVALNPRSDIDLLFLYEKVLEGDPITKAILYDLFDLRFDVGYSTRTIQDCLAIARQDTESLTAMLDARYLLGDVRLAQRLESQLYRQFGGRKSRGFVARQREERRRRHARAGLSVQLLEPNVKESPGGLRDTHTVGWLLRIRRGVKAPEGLLSSGLLGKKAHKAYLASIDYLLRTRNELHFATGKRYDVLEHDIQPTIADGLGYRDEGHELAVERFMRDYYQHARRIKHLSDLVLDRLDGGTRRAARRAVNAILHRALDDGSVLSHNHIGLPTRSRSFFLDDPNRLLSLFLNARRFGVALSEAAQRAVSEHLHLIDESFRQSSRSARTFLNILRGPQGVAAILHTMHELGVLGAYVPEFQTLDCLVQYNRYHVYTADEHTLVALEYLEDLGTPARAQTDSARPPQAEETLTRLRQVFNEIPRRHLLYIALLMHDVGRSTRGDDHSSVGAAMARRFATRLGLTGDQADTIEFLVQHHLAMSHISQRRDLGDVAMLAGFARAFRNPDELRMLYLLTYADLSAVTRTAWTAWKSQLLGELYLKTFDIVTIGQRSVPGRDAFRAEVLALTAALAPTLGHRAVDEHLSNLPARYAGMYDADQVKTHLDLIQLLQEAPVAVANDLVGPYSDLTVCTRDKPYRLSEICGVLAANDTNIIGAQAYTRADGVVIDVFQVTAIDGEPAVTADRLQSIRRHLTEVFRAETSVETLFAQHQRRWSRRRSPAIGISTEILFENEVSDRYSVIDIFAQDTVGLLYVITRALSDLGLDIYAARISTQADKAVDSFYVTRDGEKVVSPQARDHIRHELAERIGPA